ncbi:MULTISPECIES: zinc-binding alcohol dehydrogenase family protein [unclassified Chelatococcus]|uniref:zinc-binding alcohol dehydrogenase family protein n=1 Tax=unclassified Chelatococcus TaxID=2638111 RepID=UPI0020BDE701|nr:MULTISPECIES: zinc-binding alcohol dehydrogenase family protein [unclassified Chelatococcus]
MKALSIDQPGVVSYTELPWRPAGIGEIGIRTAYIGYCGSDLNSFRGKNPLVKYPRVPGHEISGVIESIGADVPGHFQVGQHVCILPYFNCGICNACRMGRPNACKHNETLGVQREGALTESIAVPFGKVIPVDGLALRDLALVEPLAVGFHAVRRAEITEGERVVVLGCGVIGLGAVLGAVTLGARVIAVDLAEAKLAQAKGLGAENGINASKLDVAATIRELIGEDGPHVVIEAVGAEQTFTQSIDIVGSCGRVVYVGYAKNPVSYETRFFLMKEIDIRGSRGAQLTDFERVITVMKQRPEIGDLVISRVAPFAEAADAMRAWDADPGAFTKILVDVHGTHE